LLFYSCRVTLLVEKLQRYAILDSEGNAVPCGEQKHATWFLLRGGDRRSLIKRHLIGNYLIETCFKGDAFPHFWRVRLTSPPNPPPASGSFLAALESSANSALSYKAETISEALKRDGPVQHELSFTTREDALSHHGQLIKAVRKRERLKRRKGPEKTQVLLAELGEWCAEKWGRQSELARAIGVTPQAVNDWLNGRKKMTGEQALRVSEFVAKTRSSRWHR
jgi:hypothetical protein